MTIFDGFEVYQIIHTRLKIYPDRVRLYKFYDPEYLRRYDYDEARPNSKKKKRLKQLVEDNEAKSLSRAKNRVLDLALCNNFDLMPTFTFDPKKVDRYDDEVAKKTMSNWLNHQRATYGKFNYIVIPEKHKDGALHFHGLFGGYKGVLKDSGHKINGRTSFNILSYRSGFSSAVEVDNQAKAASYITKYITKDMPFVRNKQRYWCSNKLKRPLCINNPKQDPLAKYWFAKVLKTTRYELFEFEGVMSDLDILKASNFDRLDEDDLTVMGRS